MLYNEIEELIKKSLDELQGGLKEKLEKLHNFSILKDLEAKLLYELNSLLITKPIGDYIKEKIIKIIERNINEMLFDAELKNLVNRYLNKLQINYKKIRKVAQF